MFCRWNNSHVVNAVREESNYTDRRTVVNEKSTAREDIHLYPLGSVDLTSGMQQRRNKAIVTSIDTT